VTPDAVLWCCVGIAGLSLLRELDLLIEDLKAERNPMPTSIPVTKEPPQEASDASVWEQ
jgi:hypothetical protein